MKRFLPFQLRIHPGPVAGALLIAIANAIDIAVSVRWPPAGAPVRAAHHAFDVLETLGVGFVAGVLIGTVGSWLRHHPKRSRLVYFVGATVLSYLVLGQDLRHQAEYVLTGIWGHLLFAVFVALCGAALPLAHAIGLWGGRRRILKWVIRLVALGGITTSHLIVRDDYAGLHAAIEWTAATVMFGTATLPLARVHMRRVGRLAFAALAAAGALAIALPPSNRTRLELFRAPGALGAWAMARTVWSGPPAVTVAPPPRATVGDSEVAPSLPKLTEEAPVVVMITIDATRADVVFDKDNAKTLPFFTDLSNTAATFVNAVTPGSQTSVSLTTLFSGRYFSQLYWSRYGKGSARYLYPAEDKTPRFPEILQKAGVITALFGGTNFLANEYGVARGFSETKVPTSRRHSMAAEVLDPLIARLSKIGDEPAFLYAHIMEPHAPYDRGKKKGSEFEKYISEVGVADAQVARVARVLAQRFPTRGVLIISSDHGEAFGEHGTYQHTKTLYEELLRVPLFVRGANVKARRIHTRVSLVDLGPTILDLFGVTTPPGFMGVSLVPILRGEGGVPARPVLAEGRLRRALYSGDVKVIEDLRRKVVEAYDLSRDPKELRNLFDDRDPRAEVGLAALRAFFSEHEIKRPGYSHPYKP